MQHKPQLQRQLFSLLLLLAQAEARHGRSASTSIGGQPSALAVDGQGTQYVAAASEVHVIQDSKKVASVSVPSAAGSAAISSQSLLAVGCADSKVYLFSTSSSPSALKAHSVPALDKNRAAITALSFSPDGSLLAAGDSNGKIQVYSLPSGELKTASWVFHTAKITSIAWSPAGTRAVSGSLDTNVYVWNTVKPMKNVAIKNAHAGGVTGVAYLDEETVVSAGSDAAIRTWSIKHHVL